MMDAKFDKCYDKMIVLSEIGIYLGSNRNVMLVFSFFFFFQIFRGLMML